MLFRLLHFGLKALGSVNAMDRPILVLPKPCVVVLLRKAMIESLMAGVKQKIQHHLPLSFFLFAHRYKGEWVVGLG